MNWQTLNVGNKGAEIIHSGDYKGYLLRVTNWPGSRTLWADVIRVSDGESVHHKNADRVEYGVNSLKDHLVEWVDSLSSLAESSSVTLDQLIQLVGTIHPVMSVKKDGTVYYCRIEALSQLVARGVRGAWVSKEGNRIEDVFPVTSLTVATDTDYWKALETLGLQTRPTVGDR